MLKKHPAALGNTKWKQFKIKTVQHHNTAKPNVILSISNGQVVSTDTTVCVFDNLC